MLSAMEYKRQHGDSREILSLFQEVMDEDIGSHQGIAKMQSDMETSVNRYLSRAVKRFFLEGFRGRQALWTLMLFAAIYACSQVVVAQKAFFLISLGAVLFGPVVHVIIKSWRRLYRLGDRRKPSLVVSSMLNLSNFLIPWFMVFVLNLSMLLSLFSKEEVSRDAVLVFLGPAGLSLLLTLAIVYWQGFAKTLNTDYKRMLQTD